MSRLHLVPVATLVALLLLGAPASDQILGQTAAPETGDGGADGWAPPQTPWGEPDLQGIWSSGYILTPLERPDQFEGREFLTDEEKAGLEEAAFARLDHSTMKGRVTTCTWVERFVPAGPGRLIYRVTVEDSTVFTQPWTMRFR